jgi:hypothetical protein
MMISLLVLVRNVLKRANVTGMVESMTPQKGWAARARLAKSREERSREQRERERKEKSEQKEMSVSRDL